MKIKTAVLNGKPDAGNPHVRFDEGEVPAAKPRRGSLLYKKLSFAALVALMVGAAFAASDAELAKLVAEDLARPVRPGGVGGQEFWNANALWFVYPPAFDFPAVEGAEKYQFRVIDSAGKVHEFTDANPKASLVKVWGELPDGMNVLWWEASGWGPLRQASRVFWKMAPYRPGSYPKPPYGYGEAVRRGYGYVLDLKFMRTFVETGKPDPEYLLNCYPAKMDTGLINGMICCAKVVPERREDALRLARAAADHLLAVSQPADAPLAYFPPTYSGQSRTAKEYAGMNMLRYPAFAAQAYLSLHDVTKERKYLDAAFGIAATYLRLQGEDGTWYLKLYEKDGRPVNPNRLQPLGVVDLFDEVFRRTGDAAYRAAADRAFAFVEKGPLHDWNWEGQFEDILPCGKYVNLSKPMACDAALYLLRRWPKDAGRIAQAREILRFSEDQFVLWEVPEPAAWLRYFGMPSWKYNYRLPAVIEQYHYRELIDASAAKLIRTYLALYRATGNPLDLAKARTLGDSCVRMQRENGRIPTLWNRLDAADVQEDWVDCMIETLGALQELDEAK